MTIKECIDIVDNLKPNQYSIENKVDWLSYIDHSIINEVLLTHEGYDGRYDNFAGYSPDKLEMGLIVPSPYDRLYPAYLKMKIDEENGETARYNNSATLFNAYYMEYKKWYNSKHMPLSPSERRTLPQSKPSSLDVSDVQLEQLRKLLYAEFHDDMLKEVSDDKLYAIVKTFMDTNAQMLKGKDGRDGVDGKDGINGKDGLNGANGVGIQKAWVEDGELKIALTSGVTTNLGVVKGEKGDRGERGMEGAKGDKGDRGEKGDKGDRGEQGIQGVQGLQGLKGDKGDKGEQGIQGIQGEKGEKGDRGDDMPAIITSASGEVVTTTDSAKVKPKNIKLFGKGKQEVVPPTNILECTSVDATQYGLTFTHVYKDRCLQYINVNGVVSIGDSGTAFFKVGTITPTEDMEVTFSGAVNGSASTYSFNLQNASNGNYLVDDIGNGSTVVLEGGVTYNAYIVCRSGATLNNVRFYPQIEKGNVKTSYKPFVGNEPSPNMNYPQKVEFLGESGSIQSWLIARNLFAGNIVGGYLSNNDGSISSETENIVNVACIKNYIPLLENILTVLVQGYSSDMPIAYAYRIAFYDKDKKWISNTIITQEITKIQAPDDAKYVRFSAGALDTMAVYFGDISNALYEAPTSQPFTFQTPNGLRGIPLGQTIPGAIKNSPIHMSGVYWDGEQYQIADTENENGKDVQRIIECRIEDFNEVKVSGDSNWYDSTKSYSYEIMHQNFGAMVDVANAGLCTHFQGHGFNEFYMKGIETGFMNSQNYLVVNISKSYGICTTVDEFKQFCIDNDVKFYKLLKEPIITDTTEEEKAQLDALVMNYPNTTIVNDEGAYMEVEYVADTKMYVDESKKELEERIDEIVIEGGGDVDLSGYATKKYVDDLVSGVREAWRTIRDFTIENEEVVANDTESGITWTVDDDGNITSFEFDTDENGKALNANKLRYIIYPSEEHKGKIFGGKRGYLVVNCNDYTGNIYNATSLSEGYRIQCIIEKDMGGLLRQVTYMGSDRNSYGNEKPHLNYFNIPARGYCSGSVKKLKVSCDPDIWFVSGTKVLVQICEEVG